uniref:Putative secreted protein n=1 Tax=Panstrongylus lignarius TaxID=156445 RepID=A0A224Y4W4_9HEMI
MSLISAILVQLKVATIQPSHCQWYKEVKLTCDDRSKDFPNPTVLIIYLLQHCLILPQTVGSPVSKYSVQVNRKFHQNKSI